MIESRLLVEMRALREALHRHSLRTPVRHGWLGYFIHDLEYNPTTQYKVHLYAAVFWIINAVAATCMLIFFPDQWAAIAVFYVAIVSLYANFATDYGAMSAALAARGQALPEIPTEPAHATQEVQQ